MTGPGTWAASLEVQCRAMRERGKAGASALLHPLTLTHAHTHTCVGLPRELPPPAEKRCAAGRDLAVARWAGRRAAPSPSSDGSPGSAHRRTSPNVWPVVGSVMRACFRDLRPSMAPARSSSSRSIRRTEVSRVRQQQDEERRQGQDSRQYRSWARTHHQSLAGGRRPQQPAAPLAAPAAGGL